MMENWHFIVMLDGSSYRPMLEHMLMEIAEKSNVTFVVDSQNWNKRKSLLLKRKVQYITKGCFDFLAYEENKLFEILDDYCGNRKQNVVVLFLNSAINYAPYLPGTLKKYKKKWKNLKYVLFYLDIMNTEVSRCANILRKQNVFDLVYTIDSNDASSSDCFLWNTFYSFNKKYSDIPIKNDMYFCGAPKGRDDILISCMREAKEKNVDLSMDLICFDEFELYDRGFSEITIHTSEDFLPYEEVLQNELHARCILEVVQKGQTALTLRPYEAVVYNRKVFSNNKNILKCRFYDERFMRYFESPEDIDWEWVKDDTKIDYGYFAGGVFLSDTSFGRYQEKAENGTFVTVKSIRQGKNICEK